MKSLLAWLAGCAAAGVCGAATMRPSVLIYGDLRDAFGIRLNAGERVSAYLGATTAEVARTTVATYPDGVNYRLNLDVYDPATAAPGQVKPGDTVRVRLPGPSGFLPTIGTNSLIVPGDGAPARINLIVGADSDGDGLPDDWEQMVVANSGGAVTNINQVGHGRDLDKDGMTDDQEFWYGSFAFLAGDELRAGDLKPAPGGRLAFTFLTILGTSYRVQSCPNIRAPVWSDAAISLTPTGPAAAGDFLGNGNFVTIYIQPAASPAYYRLKAK